MITIAGDLKLTDFFCGAGGSSQGAASVPGVRVTVAANHWDRALESHGRNFPDALHKKGDIRELDLTKMPFTQLKWDSPECPYWSPGRGEQQTYAMQPDLFGETLPTEAAERSRALMWDVPRYLEAMQLRGHTVLAGVVENVTDVCKWIHFRKWRTSIENLGYRTRLIALNSMHAQSVRTPRAPQSRDRFYLAYWHISLNRDPDWDKWLRPAAWCGRCEQDVAALQSWKKIGNTMGRYRQQYDYRCPHMSCRGQIVEPYVLPAAAIIDWTDLGQRLGDRDKPLAPKTMARIEAGFRRYAEPITLAAAGHTFERRPGVRTRPASQPLTTQTTTAATALACPPLLVPAGGSWNDEAVPVTGPARTRTTRENEALVCSPFITVTRGGQDAMPVADPFSTLSTSGGHHWLTTPGGGCNPYLVPLRSGRNRSMPITDPTATIVANGSGHGLVTPDAAMARLTSMVMRNNTGGAEMCTPTDEPLRTLTTGGHQSLVDWRLLVPYYGTGVARPDNEPVGALSTHARYGVATGAALQFVPDDILFRMLKVAEIHAAMAFYQGYVVLGTQRERIRQLGNAVTPPVGEVLIAALVECINGHDLEMAA